MLLCLQEAASKLDAFTARIRAAFDRADDGGVLLPISPTWSLLDRGSSRPPVEEAELAYSGLGRDALRDARDQHGDHAASIVEDDRL